MSDPLAGMFGFAIILFIPFCIGMFKDSGYFKFCQKQVGRLERCSVVADGQYDYPYVVQREYSYNASREFAKSCTMDFGKYYASHSQARLAAEHTHLGTTRTIYVAKYDADSCIDEKTQQQYYSEHLWLVLPLPVFLILSVSAAACGCKCPDKDQYNTSTAVASTSSAASSSSQFKVKPRLPSTAATATPFRGEDDGCEQDDQEGEGDEHHQLLGARNNNKHNAVLATASVRGVIEMV